MTELMTFERIHPKKQNQESGLLGGIKSLFR